MGRRIALEWVNMYGMKFWVARWIRCPKTHLGYSYLVRSEEGGWKCWTCGEPMEARKLRFEQDAYIGIKKGGKTGEEE